MNFRWQSGAAAALLMATFGCGGSGTNTTGAAPPAAAKPSAQPGGVEVAGAIAATVAPPEALVTLEPAAGVELPIKPEPAIIDQAGYEFLPGFLLAQAGQTVQFRNGEDVLHNVRVAESSTQQPVFNVATAPFGRYEHTFEPGLYNVTCDIHPTMRASILVTATPYTASTGADGRFTIANVRPGPYKLTVYAGGEPVVRTIEVKGARTDLGVIQ